MVLQAFIFSPLQWSTCLEWNSDMCKIHCGHIDVLCNLPALYRNWNIFMNAKQVLCDSCVLYYACDAEFTWQNVDEVEYLEKVRTPLVCFSYCVVFCLFCLWVFHPIELIFILNNCAFQCYMIGPHTKKSSELVRNRVLEKHRAWL